MDRELCGRKFLHISGNLDQVFFNQLSNIWKKCNIQTSRKIRICKAAVLTIVIASRKWSLEYHQEAAPLFGCISPPQVDTRTSGINPQGSTWLKLLLVQTDRHGLDMSLGHVSRMPDTRIIMYLLKWTLCNGQISRVRKNWLNSALEECSVFLGEQYIVQCHWEAEKLVEHANTEERWFDLTQGGVSWCWQRRVETLASTSKNQKECYVSVMDLSIIEAANLWFGRRLF